MGNAAVVDELKIRLDEDSMKVIVKNGVINEIAKRIMLSKADGHAILFRNNDGPGEFQPLAPGLLRIHKKLKQAFDPKKILNPNKLYADL